jgi:hypothetical protein
MRVKRFTKTPFLRQISRPWLERLLERFAAELAAKAVTLPAAELGADAWDQALSGLMLRPDGLPAALVETLFAIEELATAEGQERLENLVAQAGAQVRLAPHSTPGDLAVQVGLAQPHLLAQAHHELHLSRRVAFEYYGRPRPVDRSDAMAGPDAAVLEALTADLDGWYRTHQRGEQTVQVEVHALDGEFWFLVRHGDTYARTLKLEGRHPELLHFRPVKDDVVVYSPARDELRIHAGTKGERELHRRVFGRRLFGDLDYFSQRLAYTLEPLRALGREALDVAGIDGLSRVVLTEYQVALDSDQHEVVTHRADDVFARGCDQPVIPEGGRLVRAGFEFYFGDDPKPRPVEVRPPNLVKLGRHCDGRLVHRWLSANGFRGRVNAGGGHVPVLACA